LKVIKRLACQDNTQDQLCAELRALLPEEAFLFQLIGNNPNPSSPFPGSPPPDGTDVTLGPGDYQVIEIFDETFITNFQTFIENHPNTAVSIEFGFPEGDCTQTIEGNTGTIAAGESQTCIIRNSFSLTSSQ
jgi:hypothetical protein